jgi:hypothetical protein
MITAFEYVTVLISIVLGLGITQILTGIADLVHQSNRVKVYWPHLLWVLVILVLHVQDWWVTFDLRKHGSWTLPIFLFTMTYPITLFILARLLFPFGIQEGPIDLKKFYQENYRKIFLFGSILPTISIADAVLVRGMGIEMQLIKCVLPAFLLFICFRKKESPEWIHKAIAIIFFVILTVTIVLETPLE